MRSMKTRLNYLQIRAPGEMSEVNLKPDTFKVWEPKIIGIVLSVPVEWSTQMDTPPCIFKDSGAPLLLVGGGRGRRGGRWLPMPSREAATRGGKRSPGQLVPFKLVTVKDSRQPEFRRGSCIKMRNSWVPEV